MQNSAEPFGIKAASCAGTGFASSRRPETGVAFRPPFKADRDGRQQSGRFSRHPKSRICGMIEFLDFQKAKL
jgi:hypothetical protein